MKTKTTIVEALKEFARKYPGVWVRDNSHGPIEPEAEIEDLIDSGYFDKSSDFAVSERGIFKVKEDGFLESVAFYKAVRPTITSAEKLIQVIRDDSPDPTDTTKEELREALEDGKYLGELMREHGPISQEVVEAAYELLSR